MYVAEQLVARYEAEKVALTSDLQAASATVVREQRRRTQLEEVAVRNPTLVHPI
jgi:hypothetical protein